MALTKTQTTAACLLLAAGPAAYEWYQAAEAASRQQQLAVELTQLRHDINSEEKAIATSERRLRSMDMAMAAAPSAGAADKPVDPPDLFLWDPQSPYVRLPIKLMPYLRFGEFDSHPFPTNLTQAGINTPPVSSPPPVREQRPPIAADGTPSQVLLDAFGLTDDEEQTVVETTRAAFAEFKQLSDSRSYLTNSLDPLVSAHAKAGYTWFTPPLEEADTLRRQLEETLKRLIGLDRARLFLLQVPRSYSFGRPTPSAISAVLNTDGTVDVWELFYSSGGQASNAARHDSNWTGIPAGLRPYVDELSRQNPNQGTPVL